MGLALGFETVAQTYVIDTDACAGTEHIYDQNNQLAVYDPAIHTHITATSPVLYAAHQRIGHIFIDSARFSNVLVINNSNYQVNFIFQPVYFSNTTGLGVNISPETYQGVFTNNNPMQTGGAPMAAGTAGRISVGLSSDQYYGYADIYWNSDTCMQYSPLTTSVESVYVAGSGNSRRIGISVKEINDGRNW